MENLNITAISILIFGIAAVVYFLQLKKRQSKAHNSSKLFENEANAYADLRAPIRTAQDYREQTKVNQDNLSGIPDNKTNQGKAYISVFAGAKSYTWDGKQLSDFAGGPQITFDGKYISKFAGAHLYTWENNSLSKFAGPKLYSVSNNTISKFAGPALYRFDKRGVSKFAGPRILSFEGERDIPAAIIILLAENLN